MAETNALALLPYAADLFGGMVDLLQLESVPATSIPPRKSTEPVEPDDEETGKGSNETEVEGNYEEDGRDKWNGPSSQAPPPAMDTHPTMADSKFPPLRRASLHFLALLVRACISRVYEMGPTGMLIPDVHVGRAKTTLGYVATTDDDPVVRVMAREAGEGLRQLSNALMGF
jgi:hypothetical protein